MTQCRARIARFHLLARLTRVVAPRFPEGPRTVTPVRVPRVRKRCPARTSAVRARDGPLSWPGDRAGGQRTPNDGGWAGTEPHILLPSRASGEFSSAVVSRPSVLASVTVVPRGRSILNVRTVEYGHAGRPQSLSALNSCWLRLVLLPPKCTWMIGRERVSICRLGEHVGRTRRKEDGSEHGGACVSRGPQIFASGRIGRGHMDTCGHQNSLISSVRSIGDFRRNGVPMCPRVHRPAHYRVRPSATMAHAEITDAIGSRCAPERTATAGRRAAPCVRCVDCFWEGLSARRQAETRCDTQEANHLCGGTRTHSGSAAGPLGEGPGGKEKVDPASRQGF